MGEDVDILELNAVNWICNAYLALYSESGVGKFIGLGRTVRANLLLVYRSTALFSFIEHCDPANGHCISCTTLLVTCADVAPILRRNQALVIAHAEPFVSTRQSSESQQIYSKVLNQTAYDSPQFWVVTSLDIQGLLGFMAPLRAVSRRSLWLDAPCSPTVTNSSTLLYDMQRWGASLIELFFPRRNFSFKFALPNAYISRDAFSSLAKSYGGCHAHLRRSRRNLHFLLFRSEAATAPAIRWRSTPSAPLQRMRVNTIARPLQYKGSNCNSFEFGFTQDNIRLRRLNQLSYVL